jgi:hypothetical protein
MSAQVAVELVGCGLEEYPTDDDILKFYPLKTDKFVIQNLMIPRLTS